MAQLKITNLIVIAILIIEVQGLGIRDREFVLNREKIIKLPKDNNKVDENLQTFDRKGRTFGFQNYNYGPGPGSLGLRPPFPPGLIPPPPPPSYYQSYYDSSPVIFLREIGSMFLQVLIQLLIMAPSSNGPMDYPSYDYNSQGPPPVWQSEFNDNEYA